MTGDGSPVCPRCGSANGAGRRYCAECGVSLAEDCSCGFAGEPGERFCGGCGAPRSAWRLDIGGVSAASVPVHLAEKIASSRRALEGERKQVTVLFADLKGSMELLADRDPEEARAILDPVLERMMAAVHRFEGTVNQVMGDGIMALFGAPVAHEDHAARACYAALDMQATLARLAEDLRRARGVNVQIRVGLNSGDVVVRSIGSDLRMDYSAVGQTTHLAARMEQLAQPGTICLTRQTLALAEGHVEAEPLGPVPVKGMTEPVLVYRLTGPAAVRTRLELAAARGLSPFVGRRGETEALRDAMARARDGESQVVGVVGDPGVGKSRLLHELLEAARAAGWLVLSASALAHVATTPYLPVIGLLRELFRVAPHDDARAVRERVGTGLLKLEPGRLDELLPPLLALLDALPDSAPFRDLDPRQRRERTLAAVRQLVALQSAAQPVLLLFEDAQWIDSETQAVLDRLVQGLAAERVLLVVNYRPEYRHGWAGAPSYSEVRLAPLPSAGAEELLDALLGTDPRVQGAREPLIQRTEGNPFFLEECVRMLGETGVLVGERGAYHLAGTLADLDVPASVHAILAARIDRLPPAEKALLQSAAVCGRDVGFALIHAVADMPEEAVRRTLDRVVSAELLYEASLFPDLEYGFRHALTQEVAYGSLLQERRRTLHATVVGAMERLAGDRIGDYAAHLGYHALRGELWEKAVDYLRAAAEQAVRRSANREAVAALEQALGALEKLPESPAKTEAAIDLRLELRNALFALGEMDRALERLGEAEAAAVRLGDPRRLARTLALLTNSAFVTGDMERAVDVGERTLMLAQAAGDAGLRVVARSNLAQIYNGLGDYAKAVALARENVAVLTGPLRHERFGMAGVASVLSRSFLVRSLAETGEFEEALALVGESVGIAEAAESPFSLVNALYDWGFTCLRKGDLRDAVPRLERGVELCRTADIPYLVPQTSAVLGAVYAGLGRADEGVTLLERAVQQSSSVRRMRGHSSWIAWLGEAYLRAGRVEDAMQLAQDALAVSREHGRRGHEAWALRLVGEARAARDAGDERAERAYEAAAALAGELGMRPLVGHCRLGLGRQAAQAGERNAAHEHLRAAERLFAELGMGAALARTRAELATLA